MYFLNSIPFIKKRQPGICASLFLCLLLISPLTLATNKPIPLTSSERQQVAEIVKKHGNELGVLPIAQYSQAEQWSYMGSWLLAKGEHLALANKLLYSASLQLDTFNEASRQHLILSLANSYRDLQDYDKAEQSYRHAITLGAADACVNLGAMFEHNKKYEAAKKVYTDCIPALESAMLYLNLGALYYNGLVQKNQTLGALYWAKSHELDPYDLDIHYNLGVYHLNLSRDYARARYHFSVCAWGDLTCAQTLGQKELIGLSAEQEHLNEVLKKEGYARAHVLENRARHFLPEPIYFIDEEYGMTFALEQDDNGKATAISVTATQNNIEKAMLWLNRIAYIDMFSQINTRTNLLTANQPMAATSFTFLEQKHQLTKQTNGWRYEIVFSR
jgi:tetratricopeptide (TPR) repeat protein